MVKRLLAIVGAALHSLRGMLDIVLLLTLVASMIIPYLPWSNMIFPKISPETKPNLKRQKRD
jgi:hypothetical protein